MSIRIVHDEHFARAFKELESDKDYQRELESIEKKERRLAQMPYEAKEEGAK